MSHSANERWARLVAWSLPTSARGPLVAWALAIAWGVLPAAPALAAGQLIGHGFTDLYSEVWAMWFVGTHAPRIPTHTTLFGFPEGMPLYVLASCKGWIAGLFLPWLGVLATHDLLTLVSRVLTVGLAFHAARAWGLADGSSIVAAAVFGASPYFHGYAVEGIIEGMDGWPLALWAWAVARQRILFSIAALALCIVVSFYLGAAACLLAVMATPLRPKAALSLFGIVLAAPVIRAFLGTLVDGTGVQIPTAVRAAMGAHLSVREPGSLSSFHWSANTTWVGFITLGLAATSRSRLAFAALVPFVLSFGALPIYTLPVFSLLRFPYRWHAATLAILALAAGRSADRFRFRTAAAFALAVVAEGMLLSPIEPILPGSDGAIPGIYEHVRGPLLELPGPLSRPPGSPNPGRERFRYLAYFQTSHRAPSPWRFDVNGLFPGGPASLEFLRAWDPDSRVPRRPVPPDLVARLRAIGIVDVMVQTAVMGSERAEPLLDGLRVQGAEQIANDGERVLLRLAAATPPGRAH
jgi:hypothetical protein